MVREEMNPSCDERLSYKTLGKAPMVKGCLASGMNGLNANMEKALLVAHIFFQLFPIGGNSGANLCKRKSVFKFFFHSIKTSAPS